MWQRLKKRIRLFFLVLAESGQAYGEQRLTRMSAAVAYRGIFAIAPLMLIAVAIFGFIIGDSDEAQRQILEAITEVAGEEVANAIEVFVESAVTGGSVAAVLGVVLLLWTTSSLFYELQNDLNDIFEVPYEYTAGAVAYIRKRGLGFLWTVIIGFMAVVLWAINLIWGFFEGLFDDRGIGLLHSVVQFAAPLVTLAVMPLLFGLIVTSLTRVSINRTALYIGSLFTSLVFVAAALGVGLYFSWDTETSASTVAGSLFVILLAAYVMAAVFLLGAVVTKTYHDYYETGSLGDPPPVVQSFLAFWDGRRQRERSSRSS